MPPRRAGSAPARTPPGHASPSPRSPEERGRNAGQSAHRNAAPGVSEGLHAVSVPKACPDRGAGDTGPARLRDPFCPLAGRSVHPPLRSRLRQFAVALKGTQPRAPAVPIVPALPVQAALRRRRRRWVRVVAFAAAALGASGLAAQPRPSTVAMRCAQAAGLVAARGAIVLGTGGFTYDRFVVDQSFCEITQTTEPAWGRPQTRRSASATAARSRARAARGPPVAGAVGGGAVGGSVAGGRERWYVVTGPPGCGKSTTVALLGQRGYRVRHEIARAYVDEEIGAGGRSGRSAPTCAASSPRCWRGRLPAKRRCRRRIWSSSIAGFPTASPTSICTGSRRSRTSTGSDRRGTAGCSTSSLWTTMRPTMRGSKAPMNGIGWRGFSGRPTAISGSPWSGCPPWRAERGSTTARLG